MLALNTGRRPARRGAILLVVLAMLALFAVVALSFALYSESEATSMRNARAARNEEAPPDAQDASNDFLRQMTFGTTDNTSAVYGHDFATTKFGWNAGGPNYSPYSGNGLYPEDVGTAVIPSRWVPATIPSLMRQQVVNYTVDANGFFVRPNIRIDNATPINKSTAYTYPDRANYYLAMQNPLTGEIVQPSFFRPDLFGALDPTNGGAASNNWTNDIGRYFITRPRSKEHPYFPQVPANPDGTITGDVANLKYTSGMQKNDSLWMYSGAPIKTWRGKPYTAVVAPLILDLNGRINTSTAGSMKNGALLASNHGFGPWEVNPVQLGKAAPDQTQLTTDLLAILGKRYNGTNAPGNRYLTGPAALNGTFNNGRVPYQYARLDTDGFNSGPGADGPIGLPPAMTYNPFLIFTDRFASAQSAPTMANFDAELLNHPQTYNPLHWPRGVQNPVAAHTFGMDDLVRLASRYSDPKNRYAQTELGTLAPISFSGNTPTGTLDPKEIRALTTPFNVTQSWAEVQITALIPAPGATPFQVKLGPIDLNRPLQDYRTNTAQSYSPANVDPTLAGFAAARSARQRLATDIFLRLAALSGLVDGTNVTYNPQTHCLNSVAPAYANFDSLRRLAQYSANIVDAIDNDDIMTTFVWNPINATVDPTDAVQLPLNTTAAELGNRVVFGTELPRLVVNEAYCELVNNRTDPVAAGGGNQKAAQKVQKKYWLELHNPLPNESATSLMSDLGGARLQYQTTVTPGYTAATYGVYEIQIGETAGPVNIATPLTNVTGDPAAIAGFTVKCQVNKFQDDATGPSPASLLAGTDDLNLVKPATTGTALGTNGRNEGYYVIGPRDRHPATNVVNTISLPDPGAIAGSPLNAMIYDANTPDMIAAAAATRSCVVLRRLANPYLPPQLVPANPNYNPYISVDTLDNIPTRNRVDYDDVPRMAPLAADATRDLASNGRRLPYASVPSYGAPNAVVIDQVAAGVTPPHTFFKANTNYSNAAFVHYDRELINSSELLSVSIHPPHLLTANFSDGVVSGRHNGSAVNAMSALMPNSTFPTGVANPNSQLFRAFDLLTTANRLPGVPLGGREPGRLNINTVGLPASDPRLLQAVLDPQQGNSFGTTLGINAWQAIQPVRTPNWPAVRTTLDETGVLAGSDRPFKLAASATSPIAGATGYEETLFRSQALAPYPTPMLFNPDPTLVHPYLQEEPHRKAWNNLTTVSDGFLVIWTVGFFEVDAVTAAGPTLGKELFDKVPGDLRAQYSAVVDRSSIQVPQAAAAGTNGAKPWETKLMADATVGSTTITLEGFVPAANALQIYNGGTLPVDITVGSQIRVGYGDSLAAVQQGDGEWLSITAITSVVGSGSATLTLAAGTQRFHGSSTRVSNTLPGNPGPQPTFDPSSPANRHIVPYFTRLDP